GYKRCEKWARIFREFDRQIKHDMGKRPTGRRDNPSSPCGLPPLRWDIGSRSGFFHRSVRQTEEGQQNACCRYEVQRSGSGLEGDGFAGEAVFGAGASTSVKPSVASKMSDKGRCCGHEPG